MTGSSGSGSGGSGGPWPEETWCGAVRRFGSGIAQSPCVPAPGSFGWGSGGARARTGGSRGCPAGGSTMGCPLQGWGTAVSAAGEPGLNVPPRSPAWQVGSVWVSRM